jgi:Zn-dependent protease/CBS domain-containing protein
MADEQEPRPGGEPRGMFDGRAFRLGRLFGIRIGVDPSWFLVFVFITWSIAGGFAAQHTSWSSLGVWAAAVSASLIFFASILLHELGHSVTSILLRVPVRSITLFLFGGVAELGAEPRRARDEFLIAVAGPATSLLLSLAFGVLWLAVGGDHPVAVVAGWLAAVNLGVGLFNLLPGFPLDGGRVLRAVLWGLTDDLARSTRWAGRVGTVVGGLFVTLGAAIAVSTGNLVYGVFLGFMGWFLVRTARQHVLLATRNERLRGVRAGQLVGERATPVVDGWATLEDAAAGPLGRGEATAALVEEDGALVGVLDGARLSAVPEPRRAYHQVRQEMTPIGALKAITSAASLLVALETMNRERAGALAVLEGDRLLGVLTREDLVRVLRA